MKVRELMAQLQAVDPELEVVIGAETCGCITGLPELTKVEVVYQPYGYEGQNVLVLSMDESG
jgi:hypothetical protein